MCWAAISITRFDTGVWCSVGSPRACFRSFANSLRERAGSCGQRTRMNAWIRPRTLRSPFFPGGAIARMRPISPAATDALANRSSGSLATSFWIAASSPGGASTRSARSGTFTSPAAASSRCFCGSPVRKRRPAHISQSMIPSA